MASGPQKYPGASTAYFYQNAYGGDLMEVNVVVLHTTEGRSLPSYGGGASAPNLTAVPDFAAKKLRWYQHFDIDRSSRALVNLAGGVATNTNNVCQVELVGTCDPATHRKWGTADHIYWPDAPDWALTELAAFLRWMHAEHDVPLSGPSKWPAYPTSYANGGGQRMTGAQWNAFRGVCGHMHVPENTHGDPGAIDFPKLIALAKGQTVPEEDDVPTAAEIAAEVVKRLPAALWASDTVPAARPPYNNSDYFEADGKTVKNETWTGGYMQRTQVEGIRETLARVKGLEVRDAVDLSDQQITLLATAVASNPALAEQIAEKVAVKLAARLAE